MRGAKHRHIWPVSWMCDVLEVSHSGFHAWLNRPTSTREIQDAKLVTAIETSFKASDRTYGGRGFSDTVNLRQPRRKSGAQDTIPVLGSMAATGN